MNLFILIRPALQWWYEKRFDAHTARSHRLHCRACVEPLIS